MSQEAALPQVTELHSSEIPYKRSWIDQLIEWIGRIPGPSWLPYAAALAAALCGCPAYLCLTNNAIFWLDGSYAAGSFVLVRVLDSVFIVFFIALYHNLNIIAHQSFHNFLPILKLPEEELSTVEYRLTTLPRQLGWLAIVVGFGLGIISIQSDPESYGLDVTRTLPPVIYQHAAQIFTIACMAALTLQTIRQLRYVNDLHQRVTDIDLFQLAPAHAFASLTLGAGIGLVVFVFVNGLLGVLGISGVPVYVIVFLSILAITVFVIPLLGMRKRLKSEKDRLLSETNEAIKVTIGRKFMVR